jgi:hypothetical protein
MKGIFLLAATCAFGGISWEEAAAADAGRGVIELNRHHLSAAKELEHFRLYEASETHPRPLNDGTFLIGSGGTIDANNDAVPTPTKQSVPFALQAGVDHLIMVSCDEDCLSLNVRVFDPGGRLVGQDAGPPPSEWRYMVRRVPLTPASSQTFRIETEVACRQGSRGGCTFAVGVNTK